MTSGEAPDKTRAGRQVLAPRHNAASPLATLGNIVFGTIFFGALFMALLGALYVLKSALGINLLPDFSFGLWDGLVDQLRWMTR